MEQWIGLVQGLHWHAAGNIALAALLGGLIGLERDWSGHPAGLRTNMLVALGSCLFTILSIEAFPLRETLRIPHASRHKWSQELGSSVLGR